jgi:hypothetical protein
MSTTQTPPPEAPRPESPQDRRCPRCGSALGPDQEWCLACGAAATTEVAEPRGWRVPIVVGAGLLALAVIAIVLVIVEFSQPKKVVAGATPTPTPSAAVGTPTPAATATPPAGATASPTPGASATTDPNASVTPSPTAGASPTTDPNATATPDTSTTTGSGSSAYPAWPSGNGWTIIIESATTQAKAESVAQAAQNNGETVGILHSDDYSSLNAGYYVVFTEKYDSEKAAEDALPGVQADHKSAYVRQVKP